MLGLGSGASLDRQEIPASVLNVKSKELGENLKPQKRVNPAVSKDGVLEKSASQASLKVVHSPRRLKQKARGEASSGAAHYDSQERLATHEDSTLNEDIACVLGADDRRPRKKPSKKAAAPPPHSVDQRHVQNMARRSRVEVIRDTGALSQQPHDTKAYVIKQHGSVLNLDRTRAVDAEGSAT